MYKLGNVLFNSERSFFFFEIKNPLMSPKIKKGFYGGRRPILVELRVVCMTYPWVWRKTEKDWDKILLLYRKGRSLRSLATEFKCARTSIKKRIEEQERVL